MSISVHILTDWYRPCHWSNFSYHRIIVTVQAPAPALVCLLGLFLRPENYISLKASSDVQRWFAGRKLIVILPDWVADNNSSLNCNEMKYQVGWGSDTRCHLVCKQILRSAIAKQQWKLSHQRRLHLFELQFSGLTSTAVISFSLKRFLGQKVPNINGKFS